MVQKHPRRGDGQPAQTVAVVSQPMEDFLKERRPTPTQYNVLRIFRGAGGEAGWSCKEIGERLVQREPDITRLLGRLEKRGLIARKRDAADRRSVLTSTARGLSLLESLYPALSRMAQQQFSTVSGGNFWRNC